MDINIEELRTTAALAHLNMAEDDLQKTLPAFAQMLGFFEAMKKADTDIEAFGIPVNSLSLQRLEAGSNFFRKDTANVNAGESPNSGKTNLTETLLNNCGQKDTSFFVVPNVL